MARKTTPSKSPSPPTKNPKAKLFKMLGSGVLLLAFATQQFMEAKYSEKIDEKFRSYQAYTGAHNTGLLYLNLYFTQALATKVADGDVLKKAALDNVAGLSVSVVASELPDTVKERRIATLFSAAQGVKDLDSYNHYMEVINREETDFRKETNDDYVRVVRYRDYSKWVYLAAYFVGSLLLLLGMRYE
jgi:hypothetical protein